VDPAPIPLDGVPQFTVTLIRPIGNRLYEVFLVTPDGQKAVITMGEGSISMRNVQLAAAAVSVLWTTQLGATPFAIGI
jgi:hypothetical protein